MFKSLLKAVVGAATLPLDIAADVVTLGGALVDKNETYTGKKIKGVIANVDNAVSPPEGGTGP